MELVYGKHYMHIQRICVLVRKNTNFYILSDEGLLFLFLLLMGIFHLVQGIEWHCEETPGGG